MPIAFQNPDLRITEYGTSLIFQTQLLLHKLAVLFQIRNFRNIISDWYNSFLNISDTQLTFQKQK